jgi:hypothetical protein
MQGRRRFLILGGHRRSLALTPLNYFRCSGTTLEPEETFVARNRAAGNDVNRSLDRGGRRLAWVNPGGRRVISATGCP